MPQGKVIAVKPLGSASQFMALNLNLADTDDTENSNASSHKPKYRQIYIAVCQDEHMLKCSRRNVEQIVWYIDTQNNYKVGDYVTFDIDADNVQSLSSAKNVAKMRLGGLPISSDLISKVALLASVLLILAVTKDSRK